MGAGKAAFLAVGLLATASGCVSQRAYDQLKGTLSQKENMLRDAERAHRNTEQKLRLAEEKNQRMQAEYALAMNSKATVERDMQELRRQFEEADRARVNDIAQATNLPVNQQTGGLVLENKLLFQPGKAELSEGGKAALAQVAVKIRSEFSSSIVRIAGHTDPDPIVRSSWEDNWQLSAERARLVLKYLVEQGVSKDKLYLSGYGPNLPYSHRKEENRRVEIILETEHDIVPGG